MLAGYDPVDGLARVGAVEAVHAGAGQVDVDAVSSRALLEVGYSQYQAYRHTTYQPGVEQPYGIAGVVLDGDPPRHVERHGRGKRRRAATTT